MVRERQTANTNVLLTLAA